VSFGDDKATNADSGLDAYPSGDGGSGGNGGTLRLLTPRLPRGAVSHKGGAGGLSERVEGTRKAGTPTDKLHVSCAVVGTDSGTKSNEYSNSRRKYRENTRTLVAKDGDAAVGSAGAPGNDGSIEWLAAEGASWLHPYILQTVIRYAKDTWLAGDRRPGQWLLQHYQTAFQKYEK
jgi:hypothetical protein